MTAISVSIKTLTITLIFALLASSVAAEEESGPLWFVSGEVGVGNIDEDVFLHLTPRLTFIHPAPLPLCDSDDCDTLFEAAIQVPLRLRIIDNEPFQDAVLRREDWLEVSDYFRVIRRLEYGSPQQHFHLRVGEIGPATLGNGSIINNYYNVITTDHYRLGLQGRIDHDVWGAELVVNNLAFPNLIGLRASAYPEAIYDPSSSWRLFTVAVSTVADFNAPTRLSRDDDDFAIAGANRQPLVDASQGTFIFGADVRWHILRRSTWALTPYADFNYHLGLGSGLHAGAYWSRNFSEFVHLSSRLEARVLLDRYQPDYVDPLYEVTRYQYPSFDEPGLAGPKLRIARSADSETRYGGFGQVEARFLGVLALSAAYADATGPSSANLRLRASMDFGEHSRVGLFYYKFAMGDEGTRDVLTDLFDRDGATVAVEGRTGIWGPIYAHGQFGQQWQLRDDGLFQNIHLWNLGVGASAQF